MSTHDVAIPSHGGLSASARRFFSVDDRKLTLFLDRDGFVNLDSDYVGTVEDQSD